MTILCLMRFEDWTFREAEVCPAEHSDLRAALGLERAPDHTTFYRFMRRVTDETPDSAGPRAAGSWPGGAGGR